jgi:hypothetical protein
VWFRGSETGLVYFALLNDKAAERWGDPLRQAFHTIRAPGAVISSRLDVQPGPRPPPGEARIATKPYLW